MLFILAVALVDQFSVEVLAIYLDNCSCTFRPAEGSLGNCQAGFGSNDPSQVVLQFLVTLFNRLLWMPLYAFGERRLRLG